jgi:hypothetical protein
MPVSAEPEKELFPHHKSPYDDEVAQDIRVGMSCYP